MPSIANIPAQRRLALKLEFEAPMVSVAAARDILGLDVDTILQLIGDGALAWAWDIGLGKRRMEMRILTKCLRGYQASNSKCGLADAGEQEIIGWILAREKKPWIDGVALKFIFACESTHVIDLVSAGELSVMPGTSWRRGRDGSPDITRESIIKFLQRRKK